MIFKVQKPLFSSDTVPHALIYTEDRSIMGWVPYTRKIEDILRGEPKAYVEGELDENGILQTDGVHLPWPEW